MEYKVLSNRDISKSAIEQILCNRGMPESRISHYLAPSDADIPDLHLIDNLKEGAQLLVRHISNNDKIFVQIDSDCDGYTSSALLINYLNRLFPTFVRTNVFYHMHDEKIHGITKDAFPEGIKLVIAPDSSSNEFSFHKKLKEQGIDVLVIDHHQADHVSEDACVINNQLCEYPTKSLCGVAMVYKFCTYIDKLLNKNIADDFLDLVATGLISDMMDMRDVETHYLTQLGLSKIRNPFLKAMCQKQEYSINRHGGLNPFSVAFYIVPFVNAITRVGTHEEKVSLFKAMLEFEAYKEIPSTKLGCAGQVETRVEQVCRLCTNVKARQKTKQDHSAEVIEKLIAEQDLLKNKVLVIRLEPEQAVDKNITGLVANVLCAKYQRPTLVLNRTMDSNNEDEDEFIPKEQRIEEKEVWRGSARNVGHSKLEDFKKFVSDSGLALLAEGHGNAFGVKFDIDKIDEFIEYSNEALKNYDFSTSYSVDFVYDNPTQIADGGDILDIIRYNDLWGQEIEEPYIVIKNINITKGNIILQGAKKNTLKISLPFSKVELIKFNSNEEEFEKLDPASGCITINVLGTCSFSDWNGTITPQLKIQDYEIVNRMAYFF